MKEQLYQTLQDSSIFFALVLLDTSQAHTMASQPGKHLPTSEHLDILD